MNVCHACGVALPSQVRGRPRKWCSGACRRWGGLHPGELRADGNCERCGLVIALPRRRWCSRTCSEIASGRRSVEVRPPRPRCNEPGCDKWSRRKGLCKHHARQRFPYPSDLAHARKHNQMKNHVRRGRARQPDSEMIDRDVVGDRDGWKCGICHRKVDRAKTYPHPRSPSLDHVIPQSEGGPHTYANVRISHLACNVARSDRGGGEQLALIG